MEPKTPTRKAAAPKRRPRPALPLVYLSYSTRDREAVLEFLDAARDGLDGVAEVFLDSAIEPGSDWNAALSAQLARARVVVFFLSPSALASDFIQRIEIPEAVRRAEGGGVTVVPVLLARCDWERTPLARWQLFPNGFEPVLEREDRAPLWQALVARLRQLLDAVDIPPEPPAAPLPTGVARLRLALRAALDRPAAFELLERLDEAELQAAWQSLLRAHGGNADAALAALAAHHPGTEPHPLWSAWLATVHPARLGT